MAEMMATTLPWHVRYWVYGMNGFLTEVFFTCGHDIVNGMGSWELKGYSSIWSFFIYGTSTMFSEYVYTALKSRGVSMFWRGVFYTIQAYVFEFACGIILKQFDACSWDYSHTPYHFMGLIRLDYAPFWFIGGLGLELVYFSYFEFVRVINPGQNKLKST